MRIRETPVRVRKGAIKQVLIRKNSSGNNFDSSFTANEGQVTNSAAVTKQDTDQHSFILFQNQH